jgi:hypothetical protein
MAEYRILYWHDIPIQVRAQSGDARASQPLSQRFQVAIDNAAMAVGLIGDDEYLEVYRWSEPEEREGTPEEVAAAVSQELEAAHPEIDWQKTARSLSVTLHKSG